MLQPVGQFVQHHPAFKACAASTICHGLAVLTLALTVVAGQAAQAPPTIRARVVERADSPTLAWLSDGQAAPKLDHSVLMAAGAAVSPDLPRLSVEAAEVALPPSVHAAGVGLGSIGDLTRPVSSESDQRGIARSASFYGIEAGGDKFVFVVDMSGSMTGSRFRRARGELRRAIEALEPAQQYFVIFFSDGAYPMPARGLIEASEQNVRDTNKWIKRVECYGATNPLPALLRALDLNPDAIFLLTDGKFNPQVAFAIHQHRTGDMVPIHTIGFASRDGEPMLRAISDSTGGIFRFVR